MKTSPTPIPIMHWFNKHFDALHSGQLSMDCVPEDALHVRFGHLGDVRGCYDFYLQVNRDPGIETFIYRISAGPVWIAACALLHAQLMGKPVQYLKDIDQAFFKKHLALDDLQAASLRSLILGVMDLYDMYQARC